MLRPPMPWARVPNVMVAVRRLEIADRLLDEFSQVGLDPAPAFSGAEAISSLDAGRFDAIVLDTALEDHDCVRRWMDRHRRGVMCVIHDFEAYRGARRIEDDPAAWSGADPDAFEVTGRLVQALARAQRGANRAE